MQASEKLFLQTVGRAVQEIVSPLVKRIEILEAALAQCETDQARTKDIALAAAQEVVAKIPFASLDDIEAAVTKIPAGPPGKDGRDGADGKDGRDGINGNDGKSVTADDVRPLVDDAVCRAVDSLPVQPHVVSGYIDRIGDLYFTNSAGNAFKVGHVVGKDADQATIDAQIKAACEKYPPPKDGKDGFGLENFTAEFDGERTLTLRFEDEAHSKEAKLILAHPIYRGVWREGEYQRGDQVTRDGSQFIALADTTTVPGTPNCNWQLSTKRGRDGKPGPMGPQGKPGEPGRDGRDLTQIGPDGKKW
jgi:integrin beta 3